MTALAVCGALWRVWDGRGAQWWPHIGESLMRLSFLAPIAYPAGYLAMGEWWAFWFMVCVLLNLHMSPYKLMPSQSVQDPLMVLRFVPLGVLSVAPTLDWLVMAIAGLVCTLPGLSYIVTHRWFLHWRGTAYVAEIVAGACVILPAAFV